MVRTKIKKKRRVSKAKPLTREEEDALLPELRIKLVSITKLRRWKRNPRENKDAAPRLAKLIRAHGFRVPIICTPDHKIWSGDTRYQAAKLIGMRRVPVIYTEFADKAKAIMFALAENKSSEWARWDPDLLSHAFASRTKMDISEMEKLSGFAPLEIRKLGGLEDADGHDETADSTEQFLDDSDDDGGSWFRIVIICRSDDEKVKLFKMLGIDGKKVMYTVDDLRTGKKKVKKRRIE